MTVKIANAPGVKRGPGRPRKKAPAMNIIDEYQKDERLEQIKWVKEILGSWCDGKHLCYRGVNENPIIWGRKGYTQVEVEVNGEKVKVDHRGDPLCWISAEREKLERDAPAAIAREQLRQAEEGDSDTYQVRDAEGGVHTLFDTKE